MFTVPAAAPVTTPADVTEAIAEEPLLHVPPLTASVSVRVPPVHTVGDAGSSDAGPGDTTTDLVT